MLVISPSRSAMAAAPAWWSRSHPLRATRARLVITLRDISVSHLGPTGEGRLRTSPDGGPAPPASPRDNNHHHSYIMLVLLLFNTGLASCLDITPTSFVQKCKDL